jgi:hypothetical protein
MSVLSLPDLSNQMIEDRLATFTSDGEYYHFIYLSVDQLFEFRDTLTEYIQRRQAGERSISGSAKDPSS